MIVVSDTGPINYLVLIGAADVLPRLYGEVTVPGAVLGELTQPATPAAVRQWAEAPPAWLSIRPAPAATGPSDLHPGERETIALGLSLGAGLVLMDEKKGRAAAWARGLRVIGTLGVLAQAASQGLLALPDAVAELRRTSFQISEALSPLCWPPTPSADADSRRRTSPRPCRETPPAPPAGGAWPGPAGVRRRGPGAWLLRRACGGCAAAGRRRPSR